MASDPGKFHRPAFSRRIQSLEAWVGVDLIDRTVYPTRLTPAGEVFYEQALEMLAQVGKVRAPLHLDRRYETDMAEGLKMMALEGHGVAFLPESAVLRELRWRQLARTGDPALMVEMDIRVYRERPTAARPGKPVADRLWQRLAQGPGAGAPASSPGRGARRR